MSTRKIQTKANKLLAFARDLKDSGADWVQANNAVYGKGGQFAELFPDRADRTAFSKTPQFKQLASLLAEFPEPPLKQESTKPADKVSGQLRVRMPKSVHAALIEEADAEGVSLNQLIVSKLSVQLRACV